MTNKLTELMDSLLISDSELAAEAKLNVKTIKSIKDRRNCPRVETKRACLDGINRILKARKKKPLGPEVFKT